VFCPGSPTRRTERRNVAEDEGKVSVLLAVASGEAESPAFQETLRSIASQTYPSSMIEVVQVQYVPSAPGGRTSALNAARESATGFYLAHADSGVSWDASKLERQVEGLRASGRQASAHGITVRTDAGRRTPLTLELLRRYGLRVGAMIRPPWGPGAMMVHREASEKLGSFRYVDEVLWEYALRMADKGLEPDLIDEELAVWQTDADAIGPPRRGLIADGVRTAFLKQQLDRADPLCLAGEDCNLPNARLLLAGLHLMNDDLAACHTICQAVGLETGSEASSYWHGIVHRREPDFDNARGWFRKAEGFGGLLPIREAVMRVLQDALQMPEYGNARESAFTLIRILQESGTWNAVDLVEMCEAAREEEGGPMTRLLEEVQEAEMAAAFDWTYGEAVPGS